MLPSLFVVAAALSAAPSVNIPFEKYRLDNGLEVILAEDHRAPIVAVDLWVHVGSGDESPGRSGFAHLFEHMMFQGAEHIGEDVHFDVLRKLGATSVNGTTNSDRTNYYEVVPQNQLETALWLESDRLGFLLPMLNEKSLANQRDVVRNERRQRYDNVAYGKERFAVNAALYPEGHPYRYLTIGKHEDVEGASVDDVRAFWSARYVPSNATLALVGDFDTKVAKALIEKWFGGLRKEPAPKLTVVPVPALKADSRVDVADPFAKLTRVRFVWHGPKNNEDDDLDLGLLTSALSAPGWGRLQRALVVENPLCESVFAYEAPAALSGSVQIGATLKPGTDLAVVEKILNEELNKAKNEGITQTEINRAQRRTEAAFVFELDEIMGKAERLQSWNFEVNDPGYSATYLERLRSRTPATVKAAAKKWLDKPRVVVVTKPAAAAAPVPAAPAKAPVVAPVVAPKGGAK
ncbi:MAG: pitrilysin family protein [Deltaproteobacteria bacterium]|nr:pitrilysin family protein [Deltaproteobacteria bacterium]